MAHVRSFAESPLKYNKVLFRGPSSLNACVLLQAEQFLKMAQAES